MVKLAIVTIRKAKQNNHLRLIQHNLSKEYLRLIAFSDSSFANNDDLGTQFGLIILTKDSNHRANWLIISSYKCRRVVWSVLGADTYSFADYFDAAYSIRQDIGKILGTTIPLKMLTDTERLLKTIVKSSTRAGK